MTDDLPRAVEAILTRGFGTAVRVGAPEELRADKAYRFPIDRAPGSVIAKKARDEADVAYDPDEGGSWNPAWRLFGEWAALAFLSSLPDDGGAPRFYGGDRAAGVVVFEDLGPHERMVDVLMGDDRAGAEQAVVRHAEVLGRLHAATIGREAEYQRIRDRLGPRVVQRDAQAWGDLAALREPLLRGLDLAGVVPDELVARAEAAYRAELVRGCPAAADDRLFVEALVQACAYWLVSNRNWLLESALKADHTWGNTTWRQRVVCRLEALASVSAEHGCLEAIGETARRTASRLRALWPPEACELPLFPAFR